MHCASIPVCVRLAAGLALFGATVLPAHEAFAGAIVVGQSTANNGPCTVSSIQAAINRANGFGGYNLILVTDDVADGVYHENLNLSGLRNDLSLEIVGGYDNCADLQPTASGKASIYGGGRNAPVMNISGRVDLKMRGFWMEGGTDGIRWTGGGHVELAETTLNNNGNYGFHLQGSTDSARLTLSGGVAIRNHAVDGISVHDRAFLKVRGDRHQIASNGIGVQSFGSGSFDIGATGPVFVGNRDGGVKISGDAIAGTAASYLFSTEPGNPLVISGNDRQALFVLAHIQPRTLCLRNVGLAGNPSTALRSTGHAAHIELNGAGCQFPPEAAVACTGTAGTFCNTISGATNSTTTLIRASEGGSIDLHRVVIRNNRATSLLSTNLGAGNDPRASSITLTNAVVRANEVWDNLFEALHGGIVDIWDSTVFGNTGGFPVSFVGINPGLLQATNVIIDQPQFLMDFQGAASTARLTRLLAENTIGANGLPQDDIRIGRPIYADEHGRLAPQSLGIDYAPAGGGVDLDGNPRDLDTQGIPNINGPRDLGAFEVQAASIDRIFAHGFD